MFHKACQTFLFFLKSPNLDGLEHISIQLLTSEAKPVTFSQRIFKCRELIFTEPEILASPDPYYENLISAICPKNRLHSPEFREKIDKMRLEVIKVDSATPHSLQECLQYTAVSKLAPQWNSVEHLLVQGRDFLTSSNPMRAIYLDVMVNETEITVCVAPTCVRIPPFRIENYIDGRTPNESPGAFVAINENIRVLPSFKVGKAVSISKRIPAAKTSALKNYADFRKYWKNMYGYRLPDIPEEDVWYVNVLFNVRWTPLTYPYFCVRPYGMTHVQRVDPQPTLQSFIADFCKKVGQICQEKCQILDLRASFPLLKMYPATEVHENAIPKLGTTYTMVNDKPYRSAAASRTDTVISSSTKSDSAKGMHAQNSTNSGRSHNVRDNVSKSSALKVPNRSNCDPANLNDGGKSTSYGCESAVKSLSKASQSSDDSPLVKRIEQTQYRLPKREDLDDDGTRYFKKLGTPDLSYLLKIFQNLPPPEPEDNSGPNKNGAGENIEVEPRYVPNFGKPPKQNRANFKEEVVEKNPNNNKPKYVPNFQPKKQKMQTLPEMFAKVRNCNKRKRDSKDDSRLQNGVSVCPGKGFRKQSKILKDD